MRIRHVVTALSLAAVSWTVQPSGELAPRTAEAAVSIAYSLDELIDRAPSVVVAKAIERRSLWEEVGGSRRIVTYTRVEVEQVIYGKPGKSAWVRTLGGVVDRIGQQVGGEAQLAIGKRALLFMAPAGGGAMLVAGAAQGHYPLLEPKTKDVAIQLRASPLLGRILPRPGPSISAQELLLGKPLEEAIATIRSAKARRDALLQQRAQ